MFDFDFDKLGKDIVDNCKPNYILFHRLDILDPFYIRADIIDLILDHQIGFGDHVIDVLESFDSICELLGIENKPIQLFDPD